MKVILSFVSILVFIMSACSSKTQSHTKAEEINVAILLPISGKWEYREYENSNEMRSEVLTYFLWDRERARKGSIYSNMIRDRIETAASCGGILAKVRSAISGTDLRINIVDRKRIQKILEEQRFQQSGFVDPDTMVELGKLIGANKLVFVEPRYISFKKDYYKDINRLGIPGIREKGVHYCVSFRASVRANVSVIDVKTGRIEISKLYEGESPPQRQCSKLGWRTDELPPPDDIIDIAMKEVADKFASDFCGEIH